MPSTISEIGRTISGQKESVREAFQLLREHADEKIVPLLNALEDAHLTTLATLEGAAELYTTVDLTLRAAIERAGG